MQPAFGISQCAGLSALHRSDVRIIIIGMRAGVKSKNLLGELGNLNEGTKQNMSARMGFCCYEFTKGAKLLRARRVCFPWGQFVRAMAAKESVVDLNKMRWRGKRLRCCNHPSSGTSA